MLLPSIPAFCFKFKILPIPQRFLETNSTEILNIFSKVTWGSCTKTFRDIELCTCVSLYTCDHADICLFFFSWRVNPRGDSLLPATLTDLTFGITLAHTSYLTFKTIRGLSLWTYSHSSAFITSFLCHLYRQEFQSHTGIQQSFHPHGAGTEMCSNGIWRQRLSWLQQKIKHTQFTGSEHNLGLGKDGTEGLVESTKPTAFRKLLN